VASARLLGRIKERQSEVGWLYEIDSKSFICGIDRSPLAPNMLLLTMKDCGRLRRNTVTERSASPIRISLWPVRLGH
jgi:hypothetical protein